MESIRRLLRVERRDINYLRSTLESYDGMAVVRTIDSCAAHIELMIAPGCEGIVHEVLESLVNKEDISMINLGA